MHVAGRAKMDSSIPIFLRHLRWAEELVNASKLCDYLVHILCCRSLTCDSPPPSITSQESLAVSSQPIDTWYQAIPQEQGGEVTEAPEYPECFTTYRRITHFVEYLDVAEVSSRFEVNWSNFFTYANTSCTIKRDISHISRTQRSTQKPLTTKCNNSGFTKSNIKTLSHMK